MNFGEAIEKMREGERVARRGWNGKGMFIFIVPYGWEFSADVKGVDDLRTDPFIAMKTAVDTVIPWLASQADMLCTDWGVV